MLLLPMMCSWTGLLHYISRMEASEMDGTPIIIIQTPHRPLKQKLLIIVHSRHFLAKSASMELTISASAVREISHFISAVRQSTNFYLQIFIQGIMPFGQTKATSRI